MNQQRRMILALVLCFIVVMGVQYFFSTPKEKPEETPDAEQTEKEKEQARPPGETAELPEDGEESPGGETTAPDDDSEPGTSNTAAFESLPEGEIIDVPMESEYLRLVFTTRGAALKTLEILPAEGERYGIKLIDFPHSRSSLVLSDEEEKLGLSTAAWTALPPESNTRRTFVLERNGVRIEKTYDITPGEEASSKYGLRVTLKVRNTTREEKSIRLRMTGAAGISLCDEASPNVHGHICWKDGDGSESWSRSVNDVFEEPEDPEEETKKAASKIYWTATTNKYFLAALIPQTDQPGGFDALMRPTVSEDMGGKEGARENSIETELRWETKLKPEEEKEMGFVFFASAREKEKLGEFIDIGMDKLVDTGGFFSFLSPISMAILWVLRSIVSVTHNYGVAIIILTFLIRLAMFPLMRKQQAAAMKMQKVAPVMKQIKEKHKKDRAKQNEEIMKLYSKHGINPLMGCLPLLIQMPILIGMFTALRIAVDLRKATFLYISDLSVADGVSLGIKLNWSLPFGLTTFYYFNPLPIIMVFIWVLQQRLMPRSKDPQAQSQQKIMMIMPVFFFLLLYNYAAGLALYITFSSLFGIIEQTFIKRIVAREMEHSPIPEPVETVKKKIRSRRR